jgi:hypothetical protein
VGSTPRPVPSPTCGAQRTAHDPSRAAAGEGTQGLRENFWNVPPSSSPSRAGCPSPGPRPVRALQRGPAGLLPAGLAGLWRAGAAGEGSRWRGVGAGGLLGGAGGCAVKSGPVKSGFIFPILAMGYQEDRGSEPERSPLRGISHSEIESFFYLVNWVKP